MVRKSYSGAAASTTLTAGMLVGDTTASVAATTNWPNTTQGPFVIVIDRGLGTEEKILVSAFSPTAFTVAAGGRGYDGTTAVGHSNGATVNHCIDAVTINEANQFVNTVGTVTPSASAVGDTAVDGTSTVAAAADHKHSREVYATVTSNSNVGDAKNDGSSASPARADHKHAREAFGAASTNSAPGDAAAIGTALTLARSDHVHGREAATVISLFGVGGALAGTAATVGSGSLLQAGNASLTFTSGFAAFTFPQAFPNGLMSVQLSVQATSGGWQINWYSPTLSSVEVVLVDGSTAYTGTAQISFSLVGH